MINNTEYKTMDKTLKKWYNIAELLVNIILLNVDNDAYNSQRPKKLGLAPKILRG